MNCVNDAAKYDEWNVMKNLDAFDGNLEPKLVQLIGIASDDLFLSSYLSAYFKCSTHTAKPYDWQIKTAASTALI